MLGFRIRSSLRSLRGQMVAVIAVLVALLAGVSATTLVVGLRVHALDRQMNDVLVPAELATSGMLAAYVDQQTGERGFLLTGDPAFLQRYDIGQATADRNGRTLSALVSGDATASKLLTDARVAAARWQAASATDVAEKQAGTLPTGQSLVTQTLFGKSLFDEVRASFATLSTHLGSLIAKESNRARTAQTVADWFAAASLLLAGLTATASALVVHRSLNRPIGRLVRAVRTVAGGNFDERVPVSGPVELAAIAEAVDEMRMRMRTAAETEAETAGMLAVYAEGERIAGDLHDTVIQRLFSVGLQLQAMASTYPKSAPVALSLVDELDQSIKDLRTVIFGLTSHRAAGSLREAMLELMRESSRGLGFQPRITFEGPVDSVSDADLMAQLTPAMTEMLSNVARHARATSVDVFVGLLDRHLVVRVADDGVGILDPTLIGSGLRNLPNRAEALGGWCSISSDHGRGTTVEWSVPIGTAGGSASPDGHALSGPVGGNLGVVMSEDDLTGDGAHDVGEAGRQIY